MVILRTARRGMRKLLRSSVGILSLLAVVLFMLLRLGEDEPQVEQQEDEDEETVKLSDSPELREDVVRSLFDRGRALSSFVPTGVRTRKSDSPVDSGNPTLGCGDPSVFGLRRKAAIFATSSGRVTTSDSPATRKTGKASPAQVSLPGKPVVALFST